MWLSPSSFSRPYVCIHSTTADVRAQCGATQRKAYYSIIHMSFCCCVSARSFLNKCESCRYAYRIRCAQIHIVVLILINSWRVCAPSGHLPIYTFPSRSHDRKMNKFRILNKLIAPTTCACRSKWENGAYCCIAAVWRECHKM